MIIGFRSVSEGMRKINSIGYAHKIIGLALLFLMAIPLCGYVLSLIFHASLFLLLARISFGIGAMIAVFAE